jgi:O-antigen/teichoic acid export membrane protein
MSEPSLRGRVLKAAVWLAGSNITSQLLRLTSSLILTRLLLPEAFGLVAAVNVLYFALVMFSDLGIWQSVVKSERGRDARFLGTAWSLQLLRGALLAFIVLLLAVGVHIAADAGFFAPGTVYADPRFPAMMAVFALCALIQGGESMKLASAERDLQGGRLARLELMSQLGTMLLTVAMAWFSRSVWALLLGSLFGGMLRTLLSHLYLPGRNARPCWDKASAQEMIGFGKWIFLSSIIGFLAGHGEKVILGASLSIASFGIFSIAGTLLAAIAGVYSTLNGRVIFPALSEALRSTERSQVIRVYSRVQQIADLILGVLTGGLLLSGQWLVWFLYDARYQSAGWMLQCLSLGLLAMRHQVVEQLMFARGQPAWVSANNALRAIALVVGIPLGFSVAGEEGAIIAVVISQFASWPLSLRFKYEQGLLSWSTEKWWLPALLLGMAGGWLLDTVLTAWLR